MTEMMRNFTYGDGTVLRLDVDPYQSPYNDGLCAKHTLTYDGHVIESRYHTSENDAIRWGDHAFDAHVRLMQRLGLA